MTDIEVIAGLAREVIELKVQLAAVQSSSDFWYAKVKEYEESARSVENE